eukprot:TRINITY_DN806_c0_g1_i1.p1 TRINITY_DN806_c0_g1~~TRINITY_DN806_c0_g1_i1.p1  ORF type:complete len:204 (-),score=11.98 TRINITY_DN806_c0_g1_i1:1491-2102(-)
MSPTSPSIIGLVETWSLEESITKFVRILGPFWTHTQSLFSSHSRGTVIFWDTMKISSISVVNSVERLFSSGEFLDLTKNCEFRFTSLYLPSVEFALMTNILIDSIPNHENHIIAGDFNIEEVSTKQKMKSVKKFVKHLNVIELLLSNLSYTFKHRVYDHHSLIDRVFLSPSLLGKVSTLEVRHKEFLVSDHLPKNSATPFFGK